MDVVETLRRALADRHRLERELGQGGTRAVYLAADLRHARALAVKVIPPELAQAVARPAAREGRMRVRTAVCTLLCILAAPALAAAQAVTGSLEGRIVSPEGQPLEHAVVTVSGPFLQGARRTAADVRGHFQVLALPPGEYEVGVTYVGYRPVVIQRATVDLGRATGLGPITMTAQPVELQPIGVTAPAISIDPVHTTVGGTLDAADYAGLPVDRDYKSLIRILPHANESDRGDPINVAGSTGLDNQYYIDGVNVTDTRNADRGTSLPYNFVRAVEVKAGGYEAMYGRALGAVVNAITYSGTDDVEANVFGFAQPSALALSPRGSPVITESGAINYDVGARVSGPVLRDRLWYSAALNPRVDQVDKEMTGFGFFPDRYTALRFAGKVTWRATAMAGLELSVFGDPTTRVAVDQPVGGTTTVLNPDAYLYRQTLGGVIASLRATVTPSPSVLLEASVARHWDRFDTEPATARGRSEGLYIDWLTQSAGGGFFHSQHEDRGRTSLMVRGTFTLGRHTVVAGAEYEDMLVATADTSTGIGQVERLDTALYRVISVRVAGRVHNRSPATYLQDSWRVTDRFTLNAGLRWSGQFFTGASGRVVQEIPDEWQPRAGFSWQLGRAGSQRFFGSYGRFYETLPLNLSLGWFVDYTYLFSFYSSDPRQPGAVRDSILDLSTTEAQAAVPVPGLHGDNFDEYSLGYERLLGAGTRLTVRGLYHHLRSAYLVGLDFSRTPYWAMGTPGQGTFDFLPAPRRDYTAMEIAAEGAWRGVRYRASYVLSRSWGNYTGLFSSDIGNAEHGVNPGTNSGFMFPEQGPNSSGLLPNDRTHVVKVSAAYTLRFGLEGGVFLTAASGSPINAFAPSPSAGLYQPVFLVPRGSAGRTPMLWNVDLRLAYALPLRHGPSSRFVLDVLHVGNPRRATFVDEMQYTTLDQNGDPASPNPLYKQPVSYQPPMGARLGVEISF